MTALYQVKFAPRPSASKLPNGLPQQPYLREAEELVLAALIQFPSEESEQKAEIAALLGGKPITEPL